MTGSETAGEPPVRPDGRRDRWAAHRAARRAQLIDAVLETVRQHGPAVDLDDISDASGVAKPVFYRYFKDKADLFLAVGREVGERLVADVVTAVEGRQYPREMIAAGVETFLSAVEADPEVYRFVLQRPVNAAAASDYGAVISTQVSRVIKDLLDSEGLDTGAAEPWGFAMVGAVRSAAEHWLDDPSMGRGVLAGYLTNLLWSGSRTRPTSETAPGP